MKSQNQQILTHLQQGQKITSWGAINRYGITRLAARISDLKDLGHDIQGQMQEVNGKKFKVYWLEIKQ